MGVYGKQQNVHSSKCSRGCAALTLEQRRPVHTEPMCALFQNVIIQVKNASTIDCPAVKVPNFSSQFHNVFIRANMRKNGESWAKSQHVEQAAMQSNQWAATVGHCPVAAPRQISLERR
jgi:hypothetical protein